jgi:hypothetical protein
MLEQQDPNLPLQDRLDPKETQEVLDIMLDFFTKQTGSRKKAVQYVNGIAQLIRNPAAKLIHLDNVVFLALVKDRGVVEFHTMAVKESSTGLAKKLTTLRNILQNMGARTIYSYTDDPKYRAVAKRSGLPWVITKKPGADGKQYDVYTLEIA